MFTEQDIRNAIRAADVDIDPEEIPLTKPFNDAGLDSLDLFNVFMEIENMTGKGIPDEDFENLQTIEAILTYINKRQ